MVLKSIRVEIESDQIMEGTQKRYRGWKEISKLRTDRKGISEKSHGVIILVALLKDFLFRFITFVTIQPRDEAFRERSNYHLSFNNIRQRSTFFFFFFLFFFLPHLLYSKRQVILVTCIFFFFLYTKNENHLRYSVPYLDIHPHLDIIVTWKSLTKQLYITHAFLFLTSSTHSCSMHSTFFPISGQPSFLFKRYIEISLRSGSRTTLYLLQWRWLPRRVAVIDGRSRCTASKRVIGSLSPFSLSLSFSLVVSLSLSLVREERQRERFLFRPTVFPSNKIISRSGTLTLTYCW